MLVHNERVDCPPWGDPGGYLKEWPKMFSLLKNPGGFLVVQARRERGAGGALAPPVFSRSIHPISTRVGILSPHITTSPPGFSDLATALPLFWCMLCSKCQIDGEDEDVVNFCRLLGKYELYIKREFSFRKNISSLLYEFSLTEPRHYYRSLTSFYNGPKSVC